MTITIGKPDQERYVKALIFGPSGHGKTRFLGSANDDPRTSPTLLLDFEGGTESLVGRNIDVVRIISWADYNEAYAILSKPTTKYKSVGIDSLTETQTYALFNLLVTDQKGRRDLDALTQQDYGKALIQMKKFLRSFRDLPMHVFFTALSKTDIDPREGSIKQPAFAGQLSEDVVAQMSVVGYMALADNAGKSQRVLLLQNQPKIRCKIRTPYNTEVPDSLENPTVTRLLDVLNYPLPAEVVRK